MDRPKKKQKDIGAGMASTMPVGNLSVDMLRLTRPQKPKPEAPKAAVEAWATPGKQPPPPPTQASDLFQEQAGHKGLLWADRRLGVPSDGPGAAGGRTVSRSMPALALLPPAITTTTIAMRKQRGPAQAVIETDLVVGPSALALTQAPPTRERAVTRGRTPAPSSSWTRAEPLQLSRHPHGFPEVGDFGSGPSGYSGPRRGLALEDAVQRDSASALALGGASAVRFDSASVKLLTNSSFLLILFFFSLMSFFIFVQITVLA